MTASVEVVHGRLWTYQGRRCRCEDCTAENRRVCAAQQASRERRTRENGGIAPVAAHNVRTYRNWGCRCRPCTDANAAASQRNRDKARAAERAAS